MRWDSGKVEQPQGFYVGGRTGRAIVVLSIRGCFSDKSVYYIHIYNYHTWRLKILIYICIRAQSRSYWSRQEEQAWICLCAQLCESYIFFGWPSVGHFGGRIQHVFCPQYALWGYQMSCWWRPASEYQMTFQNNSLPDLNLHIRRDGRNPVSAGFNNHIFFLQNCEHHWLIENSYLNSRLA
jgi:hypothetical protein